MNRFVALVVASLLAACAHSNVSLNSSGSASGGASGVGGHVSAGGSGAAAVVLFAIAAVASYANSDIQPAPGLDSSRRVNVQDCSKPIVDWSANLKCR